MLPILLTSGQAGSYKYKTVYDDRKYGEHFAFMLGSHCKQYGSLFVSRHFWSELMELLSVS